VFAGLVAGVQKASMALACGAGSCAVAMHYAGGVSHPGLNASSIGCMAALFAGAVAGKEIDDVLGRRRAKRDLDSRKELAELESAYRLEELNHKELELEQRGQLMLREAEYHEERVRERAHEEARRLIDSKKEDLGQIAAQKASLEKEIKRLESKKGEVAELAGLLEDPNASEQLRPVIAEEAAKKQRRAEQRIQELKKSLDDSAKS